MLQLLLFHTLTTLSSLCEQILHGYWIYYYKNIQFFEMQAPPLTYSVPDPDTEVAVTLTCCLKRSQGIQFGHPV